MPCAGGIEQNPTAGYRMLFVCLGLVADILAGNQAMVTLEGF